METSYTILEPDRQNRPTYWKIAKNLQQVDYLETSPYLDSVTEDTINGKYELDEAIKKIDVHYFDARYSAYSASSSHLAGTEEADKVAVRIVHFLERRAFGRTPAVLKSIHRELFSGILKSEWVGSYRKVNLTKKEPVLNGKSVQYADYPMIEEALRYDFEMQRNVHYYLPFDPKQIEAMARFTSNIWQTHPFREGNTRTIAVFTIARLIHMGVDFNSEPFENHARFFRDALVRASYSSLSNSIEEDLSFLIKFFENVLISAKHDLSSLDLRCPQLFGL